MARQTDRNARRYTQRLAERCKTDRRTKWRTDSQTKEKDTDRQILRSGTWRKIQIATTPQSYRHKQKKETNKQTEINRLSQTKTQDIRQRIDWHTNGLTSKMTDKKTDRQTKRQTQDFVFGDSPCFFWDKTRATGEYWVALRTCDLELSSFLVDLRNISR